MSVSYDIVSIGCLSRNRFWDENRAVRPAHATTTLIRSGTVSVLVDPGLPPELLAQRLEERSGLKPEQIDAVFLTNFCPVHRRGLSLFSAADWFLFEAEMQAVSQLLGAAETQAQQADTAPEPLIHEELRLLERIRAAPEKLAPGVDLFPTPGVTPGGCALLVLHPNLTVAVTGDAVISKDHYLHARIYEYCTDPQAAKQSFAEIVEVADVLIPAHDNLLYR